MLERQTRAAAVARHWRMWLAEGRRRMPSLCPMCAGRAYGGLLCDPCRDDLVGVVAGLRCARCALSLPTPHMRCPDCAGVDPAYDYALAAFDYTAPADALVLQFKSRLRYGRAVALAELMVQALLADARGVPPGAMLVPVPTTRAALPRRGFNPAAELARAVAARLRLNWNPGILEAMPDRIQQKRLGRRARLAAAHQRFAVRRAPFAETVIVVDDVMTTGATLHAAAGVLKAAGVRVVVGLAAARAPYSGEVGADLSRRDEPGESH